MASGTVQVNVQKANIGGTLNYSGISIALGSSGSQNPQWLGAKSGQTVSYSISSSVSGVSVDSGTGRVSVSSGANAMSRDFTITATGSGNYAGTVSGTITVQVQEGISGSLHYSGISVEFGNSGFQNPQWSGANPGQTVSYSISPSVSGVSVDRSSGRVSVSSSAGLMDRDFTVTATGSGNYAGTVTGTIRVNVQKSSIGGTLRYSSISIDSGNSAYQNPQWSGAKSGQTVSYSIAPSVSGVSVDSSSGRVSVSSSAGLMDRDFSVTATGSGNYTGTATGTIRVKVKTGISGTLRYGGISIEVGSNDSQNPQWSGAKSGQTVSYSIAPSVSGVSVDSSSGRVSVSSSAGLMDRDFTVTATGSGNYAGTVTGTIRN